MQALLALSRLIDRLNEFVGNTVAWLVLLDVLISAGNAISRKGFNVASNAWLELQWYLFGAIFMLGAAYTLKYREHVRVDLVYGMLSRRMQHRIDLLGHVVFLMPFVALMTYLLFPYVIDSIARGERSANVDGLIMWPAKSLLLLGFLLLGLQAVSEIIKKIAVLRGAIEETDSTYAAKAPLEQDDASGART